MFFGHAVGKLAKWYIVNAVGKLANAKIVMFVGDSSFLLSMLWERLRV